MTRAHDLALIAVAWLAPWSGCATVTTGSNPQQAAALKFTVQPSTTPVSAVISPAVVVQAVDATGRGVAGVPVTISIGNNAPAAGHADWPGTGTLIGTLTRQTDARGLATFNDLRIDFVGDDYTLVAGTNAGKVLLTATSAAFQEQRVNACLGPAAPACASGCPDSGGDGLNDAWKLAGGIDFNGDGIVSATEKVLTNFDPFLPDGTPNPHPSAQMGRKDVFVRYDSMEVTGSGAACVTASDCGGHCSDTWAACGTSADCASTATCMSDQYCVGQCTVNTSRECNTTIDCGGRCSVTTGMLCTIDTDCPGGETCDIQPGEQCVNTTCRGHDDAPTPAALMEVIQAYDAHGINLHISPEHHVVPHSHVVTYGPPIDGCAAPAGHLADSGLAVDFYALKPREATGGGDQRPFIHYALFGHLVTCYGAAACNNVKICPPNLETGISPVFHMSGLAEIIGNDIIVAYGATFDGNAGKVRPNDLSMAGTFMHELGHNLGLDHGGPYSNSDHALNYKPNYLSVMNYSFQKVGIGTAAEPGSIVPVTTRLDYSDAALAPLDENNLNETIGINSGTNDITTYYCPGTTHAPGTGPIDWDCNGDGGTETRSGDALGDLYVEIDNNSSDDSFMGGYADWPNLNFSFQCDANGHYGDGEAKAGITSQELDPETAAAKHVLLPTKVAAIGLGAACPANSNAAGARPDGTVTVTLFGDGGFAVSEVNLGSLHFHHATPVAKSFIDVNGDGIPDLVLEFRRSEMRVPAAATRVHLTGWLRNNQEFVGEVDANELRNANSQSAQCPLGGRP